MIISTSNKKLICFFACVALALVTAPFTMTTRAASDEQEAKKAILNSALYKKHQVSTPCEYQTDPNYQKIQEWIEKYNFRVTEPLFVKFIDDLVQQRDPTLTFYSSWTECCRQYRAERLVKTGEYADALASGPLPFLQFRLDVHTAYLKVSQPEGLSAEELEACLDKCETTFQYEENFAAILELIVETALPDWEERAEDKDEPKTERGNFILPFSRTPEQMKEDVLTEFVKDK